jgi:NADH-quinone oxidoreductase subunit C
VAVIDWVDQGEFEAYYIIHHLESNVYAKVATRISRNKPEIKSLSTVWESAAMHEREMWELFGVSFVGNAILKPLFLEDWTGKPPLRKDFNWRDYVNKEYYKGRENE